MIAPLNWPGRFIAAISGPANTDENAFLPAALEVTETPPSPTGRWVGYIIVAFVVVAIGWSLLGKVDVTATATGSVMPEGMVKVVQSSENGVIRAIHVEDGTHVRAGDVLIELDPTIAAADAGRLAPDLAQARLDVARLHALAHGGGFVAPADAPPAAAAQAAAATRAQAAEQAATLSRLDQESRQKASEAAEVDATIAQLRAVLPILEQKHQIRDNLQQQGFGSTFALLDAEQQLTESRQQVAVLAQRAAQARAARTALLSERAAAVSSFDAKILTDLATAQQRDNALTADLVKARRGLYQTDLRAPTDGVVEQLMLHTVGAVVTPAQRLLTVVPDARVLMVQASLPNRDVGFVHVGQQVKLKVETFNFTTYGFVTGHVTEVSRDAVGHADTNAGDAGNAPDVAGSQSARNGSPAYVVRIALDRATITVDGHPRTLMPGMAVAAEIRIGRRTIMAYLLSPIARRGSESLQEH